MKGLSGAIGYILGTVIVVPLLLYIISIIFYSPRKVTEYQINNYMDNSMDLQDNTGKVPSLEEMNLKKIGVQTGTIHLYIDKYGGGDKWYYMYIFYSKKYHKYFKLIVIIESSGIVTTDVKDIIMTVNNDDFNNPAYGTIDNPVPVLKCIGVNKSIRYNNKDYDKAYMDTVFHNNVKMYLEYIMPKKEFKARFGEK